MRIQRYHLKKIFVVIVAIIVVSPGVVFAAEGGVVWEQEAAPTTVPGSSEAEVIAVDSTGAYVGTTGANTVNGAATSLEKRDLVDGHLIWTKSVADGIQTIEVDGTGVYTVTARCSIPNVFPMICDGVTSLVWQKWNKDTGASIKTTLVPDTTYPNIPAPYSGTSAIDGTGIYVGGQILKVGAGEWAYAKLALDDGHLIWSTRGNAISTCSKQADFLADIAIDGTYLYGVGLIGNELWGTCKQTKIEKRLMSDGSFVAESLGPKSTDWGTVISDEGIWGNVEVISPYIYVSGLLGRGSPVTTQAIIQKRSISSIGAVSWELNGSGNNIAVNAVDPAGFLYVYDAGPYGVFDPALQTSYRKYDTNKNLLFTAPFDTGGMFSVYDAEFKDGYYYRAGWHRVYWNGFLDYRNDWRVEKRGTISSPPPPPVCVASTEGWAVKTPMPSPVGNPASAVVNGKVYIIGGQKSGVISSKVQVYDPVTNSWTTKGSSMITPREMAVAAVVNGKIYVIGGDTSLMAVNANEVYDPATDTWAAAAPILTGRVNAGVGVVNNKIYMLGGLTTTAPGGVSVPSTEMYDPVTNVWTTKASMPTPRGLAVSGVINDKIYVIGGYTDVNTNSKSSEVYDPSTNSWASVALDPSTTNWGSVGGVANNKIYIFSGAFGWPAKTFEYDPTVNTWKSMSSPPNPLWGSMGLGVVNNTIYLMNGLLLGTNRNDEYTPPNVCGPVSPSTLKICENSCSSLVTRGKGGETTTFSIARGDSQDLVACYNTVPTADPLINPCSDATGNFTDATTWTEDTSSNILSLSTVLATGSEEGASNLWKSMFSPKAFAALMKTIMTGNNVGTESFTATYNGITATMNTSVTCVSTNTCATDPQRDQICTGTSYTIDNGCGIIETCPGNRYCDFNWREVAP